MVESTKDKLPEKEPVAEMPRPDDAKPNFPANEAHAEADEEAE